MSGIVTAAEFRTWVQYAAAALAAFLTGSLTYVVPLLMDPSEPPISWRMVIGFGLSALVSAYLGSRITRPGREPVSVQVSALRKAGIEPSEMVVIPSFDASISHSEAARANPKILEALTPPSS